MDDRFSHVVASHDKSHDKSHKTARNKPRNETVVSFHANAAIEAQDLGSRPDMPVFFPAPGTDKAYPGSPHGCRAQKVECPPCNPHWRSPADRGPGAGEGTPPTASNPPSTSNPATPTTQAIIAIVTALDAFKGKASLDALVAVTDCNDTLSTLSFMASHGLVAIDLAAPFSSDTRVALLI